MIKLALDDLEVTSFVADPVQIRTIPGSDISACKACHTEFWMDTCNIAECDPVLTDYC